MTEHLAPALAVALQHERRRHNPLPPLRDLTDDAALAIVCEEEMRRAGVRIWDTEESVNV